MPVGKSPLFFLAASAVAKQCRSFAIPIATSARNPIRDLPASENNLDVTAITQDLSRVNGSLVLTRHQDIIGIYKIQVSFCSPDTMKECNNILQILIHGMASMKGK